LNLYTALKLCVMYRVWYSAVVINQVQVVFS